MFGQKKAVDNAAKLAGKPNKIEEARQLVQSAMEKELAAITLADVKKDTDMWIAKEEM